MKKLYRKTKSSFQKHERILLPLSLIVGFIIDSLTLTRIDKLFDNMILIGYLFIAGGSIFLIYSSISRFQSILPYLLQYSFGGIFSGLFIFYSKSGAFTTNLPFLIVLLFLLVGNEFFHRRTLQLRFWITVFSVALMSYSILIFPVLMSSLSGIVFVGGSLIGLLLTVIYIKTIGKVILKDKVEIKKLYKTSVIIFIVFIFLYATNSIPPVPLSVKTQGVFHSVERNGNDYIATGEKEDWYTPFRESNNTYHFTEGQPAYVFSSIFAPTKTSGTIYHQWSYFNEDHGRWVEVQRIPLNISGGRHEGFRGYSWSKVYEGDWKVDIENSKGQVAGRLNFEVKKSNGDLQLISKTY